MTKRLTTKYKTHISRQLLESISEKSNTAYYVFTSDHVNRTSSTIPTPPDDVRETVIDGYRNMIFGKRVTPNDAKIMVKKIDYEADRLYDMYDDNDDALLTKDFFVVTNEVSYYHVYKCLDNNLRSNSTVQPSFAHITGANTNVYQTSDGYRWKYMFSIDKTTYDKFATDSLIPVVSNTTVSSSAIDGVIDIIKIENAGKNYGNFTSGTFAAADIRVNGSATTYQISNNNLSTVNGFYTGCLLYISSGTGSGQHKRITDYFVNANGNFITIANSFATSPVNGSTFEINPEVVITGDGLQTTNAVARALINTFSTNSVYRVEMLDRGAGYDYFTANVIANSVVGVTNQAEVRPIYSPAGGHGADAAQELGSNSFSFSITFSNTESNTIPSTNDYEKIGVLKDPLFANVNIEMKNANGSFLNNEQIVKITPVRVATQATINLNSSTITCNSADFTSQFSANDYIYIKSGNNLSHQVTTIQSVTNTTHMNLNSNGLFSCTEALIYQANISSSAYVIQTANVTNILVTNVSGVFSSDDTFVGLNTGAKAQVNNVIRNDVTKGFNTFVQMYKYTGTVTANVFLNDEKVYQGTNLASSTANATIHSVETSGGVATIYTTNQIGSFTTSNTIHGASSEAIATINNKYTPELVFGSGEILYLENLESITRSNSQSETVKLIFEF